MGEIVNLSRVRKQRAKQAAQVIAADSRVRHGRTKEERDAAARTETTRNRKLDQARLTTPDE